MTVVVTAVFRPVAGRHDELVEALRSTIPGVHEEQGCLLYAIHDAQDGTITMIEKWASVADLDAHGTSPAVRALQAATGDLVAEPPHVVRMTPIPVGGGAGTL
ncbi:putative quinol monooxygenase [Microlunatus flavus]|uniref:Quinol monooxygenase YgiN n=1 Tax=Microlunatus flavus TaxID=1036181 RepID=A0A1H9G0L4_9ACTN|nr:putative quinol monooxygenase [Microlunatus flavus]SEQ43278.1 Quinol monooxygenase YgiN [Microlunatus flavus]